MQQACLIAWVMMGVDGAGREMAKEEVYQEVRRKNSLYKTQHVRYNPIYSLMQRFIYNVYT